MALDGIYISAIVSELKNRITGGRIYKIYQPEEDEICLVIKNRSENGNETLRLVISANPSLPLINLSSASKENPAAAPNFCMLLRKHIGNGRIIEVKQPDFERIVELTIEHLDEMGDLCRKKLIAELMGKHSNIIFTDDNGTIIDSIKHISYQVSSVREVLPGRNYQYPPGQDKVNPLFVDVNYFMNHVLDRPMTVQKAIYTSMTGISPVMAAEIAYRAGIDGGDSTSALSMPQREKLYKAFSMVMDDIRQEKYTPGIAYKGYEPLEFAAVLLTCYGKPREDVTLPCRGEEGLKVFTGPSSLLEEYYSKKSISTRVKQRSSDLRKIVANAVERTSKKYDLQQKQLKDTEKREQYKIYGELLTAYGYGAAHGQSELVCHNYYTDSDIAIPLDKELSPMENAKRYYEKYNKQKRTYLALTELIEETKDELMYLLSVQNSLNIAMGDSDLELIKSELIESGYIRGRLDKSKNKRTKKSVPLHYISSDGFHMYVGKNNYQNDELTFRLAEGEDLWFHAKKMPGSHVIVKTNGVSDIPDTTYEEAGRLAAYYSSGNTNPKVEIDYTRRKNLKKPPKAKPGFVIYHTNYSLTIEPDINGINEASGEN